MADVSRVDILLSGLDELTDAISKLTVYRVPGTLKWQVNILLARSNGWICETHADLAVALETALEQADAARGRQ